MRTLNISANVAVLLLLAGPVTISPKEGFKLSELKSDGKSLRKAFKSISRKLLSSSSDHKQDPEGSLNVVCQKLRGAIKTAAGRNIAENMKSEFSELLPQVKDAPVETWFPNFLLTVLAVSAKVLISQIEPPGPEYALYSKTSVRHWGSAYRKVIRIGIASFFEQLDATALSTETAQQMLEAFTPVFMIASLPATSSSRRGAFGIFISIITRSFSKLRGRNYWKYLDTLFPELGGIEVKLRPSDVSRKLGLYDTEIPRLPLSDIEYAEDERESVPPNRDSYRLALYLFGRIDDLNKDRIDAARKILSAQSHDKQGLSAISLLDDRLESLFSYLSKIKKEIAKNLKKTRYSRNDLWKKLNKIFLDKNIRSLSWKERQELLLVVPPYLAFESSVDKAEQKTVRAITKAILKESRKRMELSNKESLSSAMDAARTIAQQPQEGTSDKGRSDSEGPSHGATSDDSEEPDETETAELQNTYREYFGNELWTMTANALDRIESLPTSETPSSPSGRKTIQVVGLYYRIFAGFSLQEVIPALLSMEISMAERAYRRRREVSAKTVTALKYSLSTAGLLIGSGVVAAVYLSILVSGLVAATESAAITYIMTKSAASAFSAAMPILMESAAISFAAAIAGLIPLIALAAYIGISIGKAVKRRKRQKYIAESSQDYFSAENRNVVENILALMRRLASEAPQKKTGSSPLEQELGEGRKVAKIDPGELASFLSNLGETYCRVSPSVVPPRALSYMSSYFGEVTSRLALGS